MSRALAIAGLTAALLVQGGSAVAADWPTTGDCLLYEAAFKAVVGDAPPATTERRLAFTTRERPLGIEPGEQSLGAALNLKACIALNQRVYAAGMTFVGRPAFGFRMPGTPYFEHFSRPATQGDTTRLTYWISPVAGVNLTMHRGLDGSWTAEKADEWVLVAE